MLLDRLTTDYEYSRIKTDNLPLPVHIKFCGKLKTFSAFFIALFNFALTLEYFEKKITLIAQVFLKLLTPKDMFT